MVRRATQTRRSANRANPQCRCRSRQQASRRRCRPEVVVTFAAIEAVVVAGAAEKPIVTGAAMKGISAVEAQENIVSIAAKEIVVVVRPRKHVLERHDGDPFARASLSAGLRPARGTFLASRQSCDGLECGLVHSRKDFLASKRVMTLTPCGRPGIAAHAMPMFGKTSRRRLDISPFTGFPLTVGGGGTPIVLSGPRLRADARSGDGRVR